MLGGYVISNIGELCQPVHSCLFGQEKRLGLAHMLMSHEILPQFLFSVMCHQVLMKWEKFWYMYLYCFAVFLKDCSPFELVKQIWMLLYTKSSNKTFNTSTAFWVLAVLEDFAYGGVLYNYPSENCWKVVFGVFVFFLWVDVHAIGIADLTHFPIINGTCYLVFFFQYIFFEEYFFISRP